MDNLHCMKYLRFIFFSWVLCGFSQELTLNSSFEMLTGQHLGWEYVDEQSDLEQIAYYKKIYEEKKHLQFLPEKKETKIPKVLHFIWLGPKNFPQSSVKNVRSWLANHPDWTCKFWTDRPRIAPAAGIQVYLIDQFPFQYLKEIYEESDNWGEKSDLLRYEILLQEGGVYVDHDMVCLKPYDQLVSHYDFFSGLSTSHPKIDGFTFTAINCHFGAKPNHPTIRKVIEETLRLQPKAIEAFPTNREKQVMHSSYIAFTHALQSSLNKQGYDDIVFPNCYFLALGELPNFYAKHTYAGFWRDGLSGETPKEQRFSKELKNIERSLRQSLGMLALLFALLFFMGFVIYKRRKA